MKVGGNESATQYYQKKGASAALRSNDSKTKYDNKVATDYKKELTTRAAKDAEM